MRAFLLVALLLATCAAVAWAQAAGGGNSTAFVPRDDILLDCGTTGQGNDTNMQVWSGDAGSKYAPPANLASAVSAATQNPSMLQVPYLGTGSSDIWTAL